MRSFAALSLLVLLVAAPALADDPASVARTKYQEGRVRYNLGKYREALSAFESGYEAKPDPVFLFNIGQCYRMLGEPDGAARSYRAYLRETPDAPNRKEVEGFIAAADSEIQRRQANAPPTATLPLKETHPANPPPPATVTEPVEHPVVATPSEPPRTEHEGATPVYKKWWLWTIVAVIVVGAAIAVAVPLATRTPDAPALSGLNSGTFTPVFN